MLARLITTVLLALSVLPAAADDGRPLDGRIVDIEVYGSARVDFEAVRRALPFHMGEPLVDQKLRFDPMPEKLRKVIGNHTITADSTSIPEMHGWVIFVDVGDATPVFPRRATMSSVRLPAEIVTVYDHMVRRLSEGGVQAAEDRSKGYALSLDPAMRADQTKLIEYAQKHSATVYQVLATSQSDHDRVAAAWCAGYAPQGAVQVKALADAVADPNEQVRNNAMRALGVLLGYKHHLAQFVAPEPLLPFLSSSTWTDRNKSLSVLEAVTVTRNAATIELLRERTLQPLWQMAHWKSFGHASPALAILGRIAGIPEAQLETWLANNNATAILSEVHNRLAADLQRAHALQTSYTN
jgi:hypothetical protein